jgi:hypothetical protein
MEYHVAHQEQVTRNEPVDPVERRIQRLLALETTQKKLSQMKESRKGENSKGVMAQVIGSPLQGV